LASDSRNQSSLRRAKNDNFVPWTQGSFPGFAFGSPFWWRGRFSLPAVTIAVGGGGGWGIGASRRGEPDASGPGGGASASGFGEVREFGASERGVASGREGVAVCAGGGVDIASVVDGMYSSVGGGVVVKIFTFSRVYSPHSYQLLMHICLICFALHNPDPQTNPTPYENSNPNVHRKLNPVCRLRESLCLIVL
jgi:hypothetical protein